MKYKFIDHNFSPANLEMIKKISQIMAEYARQGYRLSLRQLYYQLVARDIIPNTVRSYKNTGTLVSNARLAGLLDWSMIEDRGRETVSVPHWENPGEIVTAAEHSFHIDMWQDQPYHVEVLVEKDALSGVLEPVCRSLDVAITANKGYSSTSTMYEIGQRLARHHTDQQILILYLGDHDPSGIDMTRDVEDRLRMFTGLYSPDDLEVKRLALNWDQVEQWQPPENPAKDTDSRWVAYVAQFGESSWELDAVDPATLGDLVREAVLEVLDQEAWDKTEQRFELMKRDLHKFAQSFVGKEY